MKSTLVQIGDMKQLQKVCLTPVDENNRLLREPPTSWDAIKAGKFMIINGQHSITTLQELQAGGCGEPRRSELQLWDAYIVWTLDEAKLRNISSFYNCTNHLNHAKPTWGNQMISYRKIWKICGRPTEKENEGLVRGNAANFNVAMHKVRCSIQARCSYQRSAGLEERDSNHHSPNRAVVVLEDHPEQAHRGRANRP